ncbi:DUF475 domain-containing protein [Pseudoclavibacter helvolus]|uniref:DUF475 domain-containing protein n=1 Tax=Pseudoclavibacter helvolus TaxID=255205 RepID=UPI0024ADD674|nr:DUF475 domain-containing protein [Pseudoclavibacter helvolus]
MLKHFWGSLAVTVIGIAAAYFYGGPTALLLIIVLCVLEISLSFDNAVVNATILERMSEFWQKIFLTIGILIAVFGMRLVFPFVVVGITAQLDPVQAITLAMQQGDPSEPGTYGYILHEAHPAIASFGGMFLLMLFLDFIFEERDVLWLRFIERPLQAVGKLNHAGTIVAIAVLAIAAQFFAEDRGTVLFSGLIGVGLYLLVNALGALFEAGADLESEEKRSGPSEAAKLTGRAAFFTFLYLEVLDASFSFDGVIGAFAITTDPILIAIGLGVGAMYIRSITIYLVRKGTLKEFIYLEHGALWAVGALAVILLITIRYEIPEVITGLVGVVFIVAGLLTSIAKNRRDAARAQLDSSTAGAASTPIAQAAGESRQ